MTPPSSFDGGDYFSARMRELMAGLCRSASEEEGQGWSPAVDIVETEEEVVIVVEMAGVKRDDLKVIIDGELVRIYGQRHSAFTRAPARFHRLEIETGAFARSFRISVPFASDQVQANLEDGLLFVRLPKKKRPQTRKIVVEPA